MNTATKNITHISDIMTMAPVIPVIVIDNIEDAIPMAEALVAGGLPILEVTLRTPVALDAMREMAKVPGAIVGAGTVINEKTLDDAIGAGAQFIVSPGYTQSLGKAAIDRKIPFLPGIANAGDLMRGMELGLDHFKFFPAMMNGGVPALKALASVFGHCKFCPTGGISLETAPDWLALENVLCVGGSWVAPKGNVDKDKLTAIAKQASQLGK